MIVKADERAGGTAVVGRAGWIVWRVGVSAIRIERVGTAVFQRIPSKSAVDCPDTIAQYALRSEVRLQRAAAVTDECIGQREVPDFTVACWAGRSQVSTFPIRPCWLLARCPLIAERCAVCRVPSGQKVF